MAVNNRSSGDVDCAMTKGNQPQALPREGGGGVLTTARNLAVSLCILIRTNPFSIHNHLNAVVLSFDYPLEFGRRALEYASALACLNVHWSERQNRLR